MEPEEYASLTTRVERKHPKEYWQETQKLAQEGEGMLLDFSKHVYNLHERIAILHERDEDHATRLQNTYHQLAKVTGERDAAKAQLDREGKRRDADRAKWGAEMERLKKDRERLRLGMSRLQSENKRLKLQDENTVVVIDTTTPNTGERT